MGLDLYDLVLKVEDQFKVSLRDDDLFHMRTLGHLHDFLLEKCAGRKVSPCPVRSAFYRLRRALVDVFELNPRSLRPSTELLPLLGPWWRRGRNWKRLEQGLALALPPLVNRTDEGVYWGACVGSCGGLLAGILADGDLCTGLAAGLLGLLPGVLLGFAAGLLFARTVAKPYRTLGHLTKAIIGYNYSAFQSSEEPPTNGDPLWERLCGIVVDQLGAQRDSLRRDTRFIEDLGC